MTQDQDERTIKLALEIAARIKPTDLVPGDDFDSNDVEVLVDALLALDVRYTAAIEAKDKACDELDAWNAEASLGAKDERRLAADAGVARLRAAGRST